VTRIVQWYVAGQLQNMGWPKPKGLFRKMMVPTTLVDMSVEQGLQICMGLGAGRPEIACRAIADAYANNPWTRESTASLLNDTTARVQQEIDQHPGDAPWKALFAGHTMAPYMAEIEWQKLVEAQVGMLWMGLGANAAIWGLSHEPEVAAAFEAEKRHYEETAPDAIKYGLDVPAAFPWASLEVFYETCEEMVAGMELEHPPLARIPKALRECPIVVKRLGV
jgi:hypothetical protein